MIAAIAFTTALDDRPRLCSFCSMAGEPSAPSATKNSGRFRNDAHLVCSSACFAGEGARRFQAAIAFIGSRSAAPVTPHTHLTW